MTALHLDGSVRVGSFELALTTTVQAGEVLAVLGPNGAGKTTLLRTIAGLLALDRGRLVVDGRELDDEDASVFIPPERRRVGVVFQDYRLFPRMTVLDNVAFAPRARGAKPAESRATARNWLRQLEIETLAERRPHEISGGQAQRVALARALASDPAVLLLDEPLAALDAQTRHTVRGELRRYLAGFAGPVVMVTHDPLEAMVLADRLLVLEGGRVAQTGAPAEVARRPLTPYAARMVGLNHYTGRLDPATGTVALDGGGELVCTHEVGTDVPAAGAVVVAVRPAAITVHTERPTHASPRNVWPGTIARLELLGDRVRVEVTGTPSALVDVTPAAVAELGLAPGTAIWLSAKATDIEAYPAA